MKPFPIVFVIIAVLGLGGTVYFFAAARSVSSEKVAVGQQLSSAEQNIERLEGEKTQLEKDLIFYKNTDFVKDNELLRLKLEKTEGDLSSARNRITSLETNLNATRSSLDAIYAIERFFDGPFTQSGLADIDAKISALRDAQVTNQWMTAKNTIDFVNNGWGPHDFFELVFLLNAKIRNLLP